MEDAAAINLAFDLFGSSVLNSRQAFSRALGEA